MKFERKFAWHMQCIRSPLFTLLAWIGAWFVPRDRGFGQFTEDTEFEPLTEAQHAALRKAELPRRGVQTGRETLLVTEIDENKGEDSQSNSRIRIAEGFLQDAMLEQNSMATREDCAFDAGYLYALEVVPSGYTQLFVHPSHGVLTAAARCPALDVAAMKPALDFIDQRYSLGRDGGHFEKLYGWALLMKKAAEARREPEGHYLIHGDGNNDGVTPQKPPQIPPIFAKISDPRNAHLFSAEAARRAFAHVKPLRHDEGGTTDLRAEPDAREEGLKQRHERIAARLLWGAGLLLLIVFVIAVVAIAPMK